ncbi:phage tail protein [Leptolyngbya sp. PCC 6406]|uniref:phage tail protein n=1 Tax=Leptolyngbya sp. PCC 6406 TaxID=1173264 RepID=UPI0002ACB433|nr:phage tail protein [Leptolyngbya sp. PCC 6406]
MSEQSNSENYGVNHVTTNRFYVEMDSSLAASFSECSGIDVQIEKDTYFEGGANEQQRIFLKRAKFGDITLKRGITDDLTFWNWINKTLEEGKPERRNINILVFNQAGETMQAWSLLGAIPVGWKTPALKADSNSVAVEELVLAYEGLKIITESSGGGAATDQKRDKTGYIASSS